MRENPHNIRKTKGRRTFLKQGSLSLLALSIPATPGCKNRIYPAPALNKPESAAVVWYSQTGNTARAGRVIAQTLEAQGLRVMAGEYRQVDKASLAACDLVIAGSPVYYYDVPENFKTWLAGIPEMQGRPVAAYVTFGGAGGNQHNTACTLLELLAKRGGAPVGLNAFGNMPTFALTWSYGNTARVLKYRHNPDRKTYAAIRAFARDILAAVDGGQSMEIAREFNYRDFIKSDPSIWGTKLFIDKHTINREKCIDCHTCTEKCPVGAIDLPNYQVNRERCILCLGCVNNCPEQAIDMVFMGKPVYGYHEFKRRYNIVIPDPV